MPELEIEWELEADGASVLNGQKEQWASPPVGHAPSRRTAIALRCGPNWRYPGDRG